jgi:hypothetical protein
MRNCHGISLAYAGEESDFFISKDVDVDDNCDTVTKLYSEMPLSEYERMISRI